MNISSSPAPFVALVPVKLLALGKSRLTGISDALRRDLAVAFALDTLSAAVATPTVGEVVVVTGDAEVAAHSRRLGCSVEPDTGDLNGCLRAAAAAIAGRRPDALPFALCADLPALDPADLGQALDQVTRRSAAFVADRDGVGTTLYAAPYRLFAPHFGIDSRAAHLAATAVEVTGDLVRLRSDVDTMGDLHTLEALGLLGPNTRSVLTRASTP